MQRRTFLIALLTGLVLATGTQFAEAKGKGNKDSKGGTYTGVVVQVSGKIVLVDIGTDQKNFQPFTIGPNTTVSGGATGTAKDLAKGESVSIVAKKGQLQSISITSGAPTPTQG
jgi:hypothetical protein